MPTSSFFFPVFFLLACASHPLSCAPTSAPGRRIFHGPFFPQVSLPPSDPPSLPPHSSPPAPAPSPTPAPAPRPKYPFSASSSTPNPSPFFPNYPAPPPPPSPVAFASFPANISSLELPHTPAPKSPSKLVISTVAAVVFAVLVVAVALFCYCRSKRSRKFPDDKNFSSGNGNQHSSQSVETSSRTHKLRTSSGSSEFLYMGTLVSSRGANDRMDDTHNNNVGSAPRKLDSPELRPLPPLSRQSNRSFRQGNEYASSTAGEEEEFYSPRVSLGGGSGSRRAFEGVKGENFRGGSSRSSSSSYSSSTSGSPAQSQSISLSPPVSLSPRRSQPKSPPHVPVLAPPPPPPPQKPPLIWTAYVVEKANTSTSSERDLSDNQDGSPTKSAGSVKCLWSPSLSPAVLSAPPDQDASLRLCTARGCNGYSPTLSMISSPELSLERTPETPPKTLTASEKNSRSPALSPATLLPDRVLARNPDQDVPFGTWNPWVQNEPSSSLPFTSPARAEERRNLDTSPRTSNALSSLASSSPEKSSDHSPARASSNTEHEYLSAPAPRPPPMPWQKFCEAPNPPKPIAQLSSHPPPLMPPSRPFMFQNQTNFYPTQPPQTPHTMEKIEEETPKPKLKPLHWDKVRASSDREMAWDHLRSSSFQLNEEMIESLFIVNTLQSKPKEATPLSVSPNQDNQVLDPKKSQNIAIALRALNVTVDEVCNALSEGKADTLGTELLHSLLKMAPTKEEEQKLRDFKDDSPIKLGPAEKFLKGVLDVPFAFKRVEAVLYMTNFQSEIEYLKKSFETLEAACDELRNNRMFLKLLEAVLKTGNRINVGTNRGDAQAFKLDTLLKLVDVKGTDGKTTLLHFVVQEITRTEGARLSDNSLALGSTSSEEVKCQRLGLQVVSGLSSDLPNVKKAAKMDSEVLSSYICKLSRGLENIEEVLKLNETIGLGESRQCLSESMNKFMKMAKEEIIRIQAQEIIALSLVKEITEYFHGNSANEEAHPFRIFTVVRDFLNVLDHVCKEVSMVNERTVVSSAHKFPVPVNPMS